MENKTSKISLLNIFFIIIYIDQFTSFIENQQSLTVLYVNICQLGGSSIVKKMLVKISTVNQL